MNNDNRFFKWFYQNKIIILVAVLVIGTSSFMWWYVTTTTKVSTTNETSVVIKMKEDLYYNVTKGPTVSQIKEAEAILKEYKDKLGKETDTVKSKAIIKDIKFIFDGYEQADIHDLTLTMFLRDIQNDQIK